MTPWFTSAPTDVDDDIGPNDVQSTEEGLCQHGFKVVYQPPPFASLLVHRGSDLVLWPALSH